MYFVLVYIYEENYDYKIKKGYGIDGCLDCWEKGIFSDCIY